MAVPDNGVAMPPKLSKLYTSQRIGMARACGGTTMRDPFSPFATFALQD